MMSGITIAAMILVLAIALLVLEMFIPSGGVLGLLSGIGFLASLILVFRSDLSLGILYLVVLAISLPLGLMGMVKYWPYTAVGRMMLNVPPPGDEPEPSYNPLEDLVGQTGVAKSKMLPSGAILVNGRTYDAVSTGSAIEPGDPIEVYRVDGNRVMVRSPVSGDPPVSGNPPDSPSNNAIGSDSSANGDEPRASASGKAFDALDRTYDDIIPDPFDDPLS